jgi:ElaB/YqjD/DUF883 family membrane-anchored ribosome-binding protein
MTIKDSADRATSFAAEKLDHAKVVAGDAIEATREKVGVVYETARDRASEAYEAARAKASEASHATAQTVEEQPLVALIGGLALGALVAAVLPRTQRETEVLGAVGSKITNAAKTAAFAARDAGKERLDELGLTPEKARDTVRQLVSDAASAATSAGTAAASAVREGPTG